MTGVFLTAEWRHLAMLNYRVPMQLLEPFVPRGTELDLWQDVAYVSVVGFMFYDTRVLGIPVPCHRSFEEVNLRMYVRHGANGELRRAVVFIRELVPRRAIATVARVAYNEPYRVVPMRSTVPDTSGEAPGQLAYEWRTGETWEHLGAIASGGAAVPAPDSEASFVTGHFWGYTRQRDGGTVGGIHGRIVAPPGGAGPAPRRCR